MVPSSRIDDVGALCKQYGPGRLPKADRRDIGAGYAGASAAFGVAVLFALVMGTLILLGSPFGVGHVFWAMCALVAIPFVVPAAFVVGTLIWRHVPAKGPVGGAVAGLFATVGTYVVSLAIVFVLAVIGGLVSGNEIESILTEAATLAALIGIVAVVFTGWLTVPAGCASGAIYERARKAS